MLSMSLVYLLLKRRFWRPVLDPVMQTIGNNLKGDWEKGRIQDILHSPVVRKFSQDNFTEMLRR